MTFWLEKTLEQMTRDEWESLCDGCGKCCLVKLEDDDTQALHYTDVACELLDTETCRCQDYPHRQQRVADCISISTLSEQRYSWLPVTCAYRLLAEGKALQSWHPLLSGSADSVHRAGVSVKGRVFSSEWVHPDEYEERIVQWVL